MIIAYVFSCRWQILNRQSFKVRRMLYANLKTGTLVAYNFVCRLDVCLALDVSQRIHHESTHKPCVYF